MVITEFNVEETQVYKRHKGDSYIPVRRLVKIKGGCTCGMSQVVYMYMYTCSM